MYLFYFLLLISFASYADSISQYGKYTEYCEIASLNPNEFQNFKRSPLYRCILEHATEKQGAEYLNYICKNYQFLTPYLNKFKENDQIGSPVTFEYPGFGFFSPTTLQYVRILGDLKSKFGSTSNLKIIEIGGGYGGQCKILNDLDGFTAYTIVDLRGPLQLAQKYLKAHNIDNVSFSLPEEVEKPGNYDLIISNFAFSEIDRKEQIEYLNKLIKKIPMGYMIINFINPLFKIDTMSIDEILYFLEEENRNFLLEKEDPPTGNHNIVLSWTTN